MSNVAHDYSGMSDEEMFLVDYKDYDIGSFAMGIASNSWYDESTKETLFITERRLVIYMRKFQKFRCIMKETLFKKFLAVMPKIATEKNRDILYAKVDVFKPNVDAKSKDETPDTSLGSYILYYGQNGFEDKARKIAEAAFGETIEEGICFSAEKLSRKTDMVPKLTEVVKQFE